MATRPRYTAATQPRQRMRQTYESFKPKSEWKYEDDATTLLVYIPGFVKEQLKVMFTYVDNITLSVKVEGKRSLGGGRWIQFSELYGIPETCDINKIDSQFRSGVLTIIMPKIKVVELQKGSEPEATLDISSPQEIEETSALLERQKEEKGKYVEAVSSEKVTTIEEKPHKGQDETSQKTSSLIDTAKVGSSGESAYEKGDEKSQMGHQLEASPKTAALVNMAEKIDQDKKSVGSDGESSYGKAEEKLKPAEIEKPEGEVVAQKTEDNKKSDKKEKPAEVEKSEGEAVAQKTKEKQKSDGSKKDDLIAEKSKDTKHESASASEGFTEGKQLLLNMGTAVIVIMGFGAYLSYTFGSFGKA